MAICDWGCSKFAISGESLIIPSAFTLLQNCAFKLQKRSLIAKLIVYTIQLYVLAWFGIYILQHNKPGIAILLKKTLSAVNLMCFMVSRTHFFSKNNRYECLFENQCHKAYMLPLDGFLHRVEEWNQGNCIYLYNKRHKRQLSRVLLNRDTWNNDLRKCFWGKPIVEFYSNVQSICVDVTRLDGARVKK